MLKPCMENISFLLELNSYVYTVTFVNSFIKNVVIIWFNCCRQNIFVLPDFLVHFKRSANWSFGFLFFPIFVNISCNRTFFAKELITLTAKVSNIFEIKFQPATWIFTVFCLHWFAQQLLCLWLGCQIHGCVPSSIWLFDIYTLWQIALKDLKLSSSCCLMHRSIPIHINIKRGHVFPE